MGWRNTANSLYAKSRMAMVVLKRNEGVKDFAATIDGKLPKRIDKTVQKLIQVLEEKYKSTQYETFSCIIEDIL